MTTSNLDPILPRFGGHGAWSRRTASAEDLVDGGFAPGGLTAEFVELKRLITAAGLLDKKPLYYARALVTGLAALCAAIAVIVLVESPVIQLANAAFFAIVLGQIGFIAHDSGHRQVFQRSSTNDRLCLATTSIIGLSASWWVDKHNRHHSGTNEVDADPDLDFPLVAFTVDEALSRKGLRRLAVRFQKWAFLPILGLVGFGMQIASFHYLATRRPGRAWLEAALLVGHHAAFLALVVLALGPAFGAGFYVLTHMFAGMYMGSVFAPNHKGMPVLKAGSRVDFLSRQVLTTRNVRSHPLIDFWYGGLNYQVEHHLFPSLPRNNLRAAQQIIRPFLAGRGLPYHETGFFRSYGEIFGHLGDVAREAALLRSSGVA